MKLVSFRNKSKAQRLGLLLGAEIYDIEKHAQMLDLQLPATMAELLNSWELYLERVLKVAKHCEESGTKLVEDKDSIVLLPCVPEPKSLRDAYAFRQHVETARRNRGKEMLSEFDQYPVFYFSNHNAIIGSGDLIVEKDHLDKLDFELELAAIIGKPGKNIPAAEADKYIAGFTVMNDFSARTLQMEEMKLNLGPAKGKDFATALGSMMVTVDEIESYKVVPPAGHIGASYDLKMTAKHNGELVSEGSMKDMTWTFAEIIERASYGVELYPGDVIGSGTVGTGCFLELNGSSAREAQGQGRDFKPTWLEAGDEIELEITGLGRLKNKILDSEADLSILEKKKVN